MLIIIILLYTSQSRWSILQAEGIHLRNLKKVYLELRKYSIIKVDYFVDEIHF